jgi:hypothetical protein
LRPNRAKKKKLKSLLSPRSRWPSVKRRRLAGARLRWEPENGIFDTFADENGRNAHLNREIAKALFAKAKDLFAKPPEIAKAEILASKSGR